MHSEVFKAACLKTKDHFAIKLEHVGSAKAKVLYEHNLYKIFNGGEGVAKCLKYGEEGEYRYFIQEMLGPNLGALFDFCDRRFSETTVSLIAI